MVRIDSRLYNFYGGLHIMEDAGRFFWAIENYDGFDWHQIPESLYRELMNYEVNIEQVDPEQQAN